jgi:ABC-type transport system substrate-binding protein
VREALEYAIDREAIAKAFGYGYLGAPYQIPSRYSSAYNPSFGLGRKFDPEKAQQLLDEAGYTGNPRLSAKIISIPGIDIKIPTAIQGSLAKIGIQIELEFPQMSLFATYSGPGSSWPQNAMLFLAVPAGDPFFIGVLQFFFTLVGKNWGRPPELQEAYTRAISASAPDTKLTRAVTDMMSQMALVVPVSEDGTGRAIRPYVMSS